MHASPSAAPIKKKRANRLVMGFAALLASAAIGTTGLAAATHMDSKPSKSECAAAGFSNYGQCVKEWAHNKNSHGGGYDGGYGGGGGGGSIATTVNANIGLELTNSNNNVINVVINLFRS